MTITADANQVARSSYIDLNNDIVQVEFSGAETLTLANSTGPALPASYNQNVEYMKGHATLIVSGTDETTNLSVFSAGRATRFCDRCLRPPAVCNVLRYKPAEGFGGERDE